MACYTGPSSTEGKGLCKAGQQTCASGKWGSCTAQVVPVTEVCDGKDNDCDGSTDEGLKRSCAYTGPGGTLGKGICKAATQACSAGSWGSCVGEVKPGAETCDNKDNDCDGSTDENLTTKCTYTGTTGTEGVGVCKAGNKACSSGSWGGCAGQVVPSKESCDNKDNDCNKVTDDLLSFTGKKWCGKGLFSQTGLSYTMDLVATFNGGKGPTFTFGGTMTFSGSFVGKIGVKVNLSAVPKTLHFPKIKNRNTDFYMLGWGVSTLDSHYVFHYLVRGADKGWNGSGFNDPEINEMIEKLSVETDFAKRDAMIQSVWGRVQGDIIYLPLHHQVIVWAMNDKIDLPIFADNAPRYHLARIMK